MTTERDKLIVEALGVEYVKHFGKSIGTLQNGKPVFIPNLPTPEGFFWIWEKMEEKRILYRYLVSLWKKHNENSSFFIPYINPLRWCEALADWLEANPEKWHGKN